MLIESGSTESVSNSMDRLPIYDCDDWIIPYHHFNQPEALSSVELKPSTFIPDWKSLSFDEFKQVFKQYCEKSLETAPVKYFTIRRGHEAEDLMDQLADDEDVNVRVDFVREDGSKEEGEYYF